MIVIQQEKPSVTAKILSLENRHTRPLNACCSPEEIRKEFDRLVDYSADVIRLAFQDDDDLSLLSTLMKAFTSGDKYYIAVVVYSCLSPVILPERVTSVIEKYLSVYWSMVCDFPKALANVYLCPMNAVSAEAYQIDFFCDNRHRFN